MLVKAGFESESLVDKLSKNELRVILFLAQQDITKFYLEDDLKRVASWYGLKKIRTSEYQGEHHRHFADDLKNFQAKLPEADAKESFGSYAWKYQYYLLGTNSALCGHDTSAKHAPLLLFSLGKGIYFLVGTRDLWVSPARRWLYQPLNSPKLSSAIIIIVAALLGALLPSKIAWEVVWLIAYLAWFVYFTHGMLFSDWKILYSVPRWLRKIVKTLIPR